MSPEALKIVASASYTGATASETSTVRSSKGELLLADTVAGLIEAPVAMGGDVSGTRVNVKPGSGAPYSVPYSARSPAPSSTAMPETWHLTANWYTETDTDILPPGSSVGVAVD